MNLLKQKFTVYFTLLVLAFGLFNFPVNKPDLGVSAYHNDHYTPASVTVVPASGSADVIVSPGTEVLGCGITPATAHTLDSSLGVNTNSAGLLNFPAACYSIAQGQVLTQHSLQMAQLSNLPQVVVDQQTPLAYEKRLNPYIPAAQSATLTVVFAISAAVIVRRKKLFEKRTRGIRVIRELEAASLPQLGVMRC